MDEHELSPSGSFPNNHGIQIALTQDDTNNKA